MAQKTVTKTTQKPRKTTRAAAKSATKVAKTAAQTSQDAVEAGAERARALVEEQKQIQDRAAAAARKTAEKSTQSLVEGYGDVRAVQQDAIEAYMASGSRAAKGFETLSREVIAFTQTAFAANVEATQNLLRARSLREAVDLQAEYTRRNMDRMAKETQKLAEMSFEVASQVFEPWQTQATRATQKAMKSAAA
jgi:phasin family protein